MWKKNGQKESEKGNLPRYNGKFPICEYTREFSIRCDERMPLIRRINATHINVIQQNM